MFKRSVITLYDLVYRYWCNYILLMEMPTTESADEFLESLKEPGLIEWGHDL